MSALDEMHAAIVANPGKSCAEVSRVIGIRPKYGLLLVFNLRRAGRLLPWDGTNALRPAAG